MGGTPDGGLAGVGVPAQSQAGNRMRMSRRMDRTNFAMAPSALQGSMAGFYIKMVGPG